MFVVSLERVTSKSQRIATNEEFNGESQAAQVKGQGRIPEGSAST